MPNMGGISCRCSTRGAFCCAAAVIPWRCGCKGLHSSSRRLRCCSCFLSLAAQRLLQGLVAPGQLTLNTSREAGRSQRLVLGRELLPDGCSRFVAVLLTDQLPTMCSTSGSTRRLT